MEKPPSRTSSKTQGLNEQADDSKPQAQDGLAEDSKLQDLIKEIEEYKPQDLKDWVESQLALDTTPDILEQVPDDVEVFSTPPLPGGRPQKMTMTNQKNDKRDAVLPESTLDDTTLLKQAVDSELQDIKDMLEESRQTLMEIPDKLEERRKTLTEGLGERRQTLKESPEGLEERRKTLIETLEGLDERRKTLMETTELLANRRKTLMETLDELEERRKTLIESQEGLEGLEERRKTLLESLEELEERKRTLSETVEGLEERRKTLMESSEGLEDQRMTLMEPPVWIEERMDTIIETPQLLEERRLTVIELPPEAYPQEDRWKAFQSSYIVPKRSSKKLKAVTSNPSKPVSLPPPPRIRYIPQKPKPQTADKATQLRAIPICPLRLPGVVTTRKKTSVPEIKPATNDSGTQQISPSFERLLKRPPPPLFKRKKSKDRTTSCKSSSGSSSTLSKDSRKGHRSIDRVLQRKSRTTERTPRSLKKCTAIERAPRSHKKHAAIARVSRSKHSAIERDHWAHSKHKRAEIIYNFYVNLCDCCRQEDLCGYSPCNWQECLPCAGLSRACTVFSTLKGGAIQVCDLLMTLHALGILVTNEEMQQTLKCVDVYDGIVNFSEFLEAVNRTSPFAETDTLQNSLRAFRKIKKGMVHFRDLDTVLSYLGVEMSHGDIRRILNSPRVSKCDKVDLSCFFEAARELECATDEEPCPLECSSTWERQPFQDVTSLVSAKARWRRKYNNFDEEICSPMSFSDDDIVIPSAFPQQGAITFIPITVSNGEDADIQPGFTGQRMSITGLAEAKNQDNMGMIKAQTDAADQEKNTASISNKEAENKEGDVVETIKSPADEQEKSNTAPIEADKKHVEIVEVTGS